MEARETCVIIGETRLDGYVFEVSNVAQNRHEEGTWRKNPKFRASVESHPAQKAQGGATGRWWQV
jgi:hypothetical protein